MDGRRQYLLAGGGPLRRWSVATLLGAFMALLTGLLAVPQIATASPTSVVQVTYPKGPYARAGWTDAPLAQVHLSSASDEELTIEVTSSDPAVATVPSSIVVPAGQMATWIPVTAVSEGVTTLSTTLSGSTHDATPALRVGGVHETGTLEAVSVSRPLVQPGGSAVGTVHFDFLLGPGGATVALASDDPGVQVPASVAVPEDHAVASFPILTDPSAAGSAQLTATVGDLTRSVELMVADTVAPETTISRTVVRHRKRSVTVRFGSSEAGSTFLCKLDQRPYRRCASPRVYRHVAVGRHIVRVKATDATGNVDSTPALDEFHVRR